MPTITIPNVFTNYSGASKEAIDADLVNENFSDIADVLNALDDANIASDAAIDPTKIDAPDGTSASLKAQIDDMVTNIANSERLAAWDVALPITDVQINPTSDGGGGYLTLASGGTIAMQGYSKETETTRIPESGSLNAGTVYAIRAEVSADGTLTVEAIDIGPSASGDKSVEHFIGAVNSAAAVVAGNVIKIPITWADGTRNYGQGSTITFINDTALAGNKYNVAWQKGSDIYLPAMQVAAGVTPLNGGKVAFWANDGDAKKDARGELGGPSSPDSALLAIVYTASSTTPIVNIQRNDGLAIGHGSTIVELPWTDAIDVAAAVNQAVAIANAQDRPITGLEIFLAMADQAPATDPTQVQLSMGFAPHLQATNYKGFEFEIQNDNIKIMGLATNQWFLYDNNGTPTETQMDSAKFRFNVRYRE